MLPPAIMDLFPSKIVVVSLLIGLVEIIAATIVGAFRYKEEELTAPHMRSRIAGI